MSSGGEGEWPTLDELKRAIDQPDAADGFDHLLDRHLDAAIEQVKLDVGDWDDASDDPDASLADAALLLSIRIAGAPSQAPRVLAQDADYQRLLKGHRRRFGIG